MINASNQKQEIVERYNKTNAIKVMLDGSNVISFFVKNESTKAGNERNKTKLWQIQASVGNL